MPSDTRNITMASQQIQIAETIRAMKIAFKRKADDSDSDTEIQAPTNRGYKLQRGAKYVREGRLLNGSGSGKVPWKQKVEHAGYTRYTIATNPPLYDIDGDPFDPTVSDDDREAEPVEEDAFGSVQLEYLLRPLTSAAELPDHPSLSLAYKSKALTQMANEAQEMLRREEALLWKAKRLLRRLWGDRDWVAGEAFETEEDEAMLVGDEPGVVSAVPSVREDGLEVGTELVGMGNAEQDLDQADGVEAMDMALQQAAADAEQESRDAAATVASKGDDAPPASVKIGRIGSPSPDQQDPKDPAPEYDAQNQPTEQQTHLDEVNGEAEADAEASDDPSTNGNGNGNMHSMTTRARARSPRHSPSPTPSDSASIPAINPWFLVPPSSLVDSNLGLPATEAEETRRVLIQYTQKQEQVVRQLRSLYSGLAKADRLRNDVWRACRAEGHVKPDGKGNVVTEMSDGEDWVDVEALGLRPNDLKSLGGGVWGLEKGKDEVEDVEEEGRRGGRRRRVARM
jgi:hypothetical protein